MLFNSLHFLFFFPAVVILHRLLPHAYRNLLLLAASYYFYMSWNPWFGLLLLGTTVIDWYAALRIEAAATQRQRKSWLLLSLLSNLGCLAGFKYSAFLWNSGVAVSNLFGAHHSYVEALIIPVGLSFYTFQSLSYTIDVYRRRYPAERSAATFALYVSFFPQLVAGPVERFDHLMPQLKFPKMPSHEMLVAGVRLMVWGYFKKVAIADRLADFVTPIFSHPDQFHGFTLLAGGFFFVVQVYCDFSGYSDIATGCAKFFGVDLMLNWRRPLLSKSLHEFWTRNHISMTSWFRDYLYFPLGGSRVKFPRYLLNLFLVFLLSGLWHGASWTFVIWGAMHGFVYIIETLLHIGKRKVHGLMKFSGWLYLIAFHTISLIAFRALSVHDLGFFYGKIFSGNWDITASLHELRTLNDLFPLALSLGLIVFLFAKELHEEYGGFNYLPGFARHWKPLFYVGLFVLLFVVGQFNANEFIYFHF